MLHKLGIGLANLGFVIVFIVSSEILAAVSDGTQVLDNISVGA